MISVIIPACNEEENIPRISGELSPVLARLGEDYEIIIIDDGSTDRTRSMIRAEMEREERIKLLVHEENRGLGVSLRAGIASSRGDMIITLDADFTYHPDQIPRLYNLYRSRPVDCVVGSFLLRRGDARKIMTHRLLFSRVVNKLYRWFLPGNLTVISSILRLYRASAVKSLNLRSTGFNINAEILFKMITRGFKVIEAPAVLTTRTRGSSKIRTFTEIKNHLKLLAEIAAWRLGGGRSGRR